MDEGELRREARERLERGELPRLSPLRIWINQGAQEACSLCGAAITESETEYELEFELRFDLSRSELVPFRFHALCHAIWQMERIRR
jgi:hypothetical protein